MAKRLTREDVEIYITIVNRALRRTNKPYILKFGARYDYYAVDSYESDDPSKMLGVKVTGDLRKIYTWLDGFIEALS